MFKTFMLSILSCLCLAAGCRAQDGIKVLTPDEYEAAVAADSAAVILDVRTPEEFADSHIKGAVLLDFLDSAAFEKGYKALDRTKTYYIYCRSGRRSHNAAEIMSRAGLHVADMKGGINAWTAAGKEVVK